MKAFTHIAKLTSRLAAVALVAFLTACAGPQSYVALLPSLDGTVGQVVVHGQRGEHSHETGHGYSWMKDALGASLR